MTVQVPGNGQNTQLAQTPQQSVAIVTGPAARLKAIKEELNKASKSLAVLLPKHVTIDKMVRIVTAAVSRTPDLLDCTPRSIVLATAQACAIGLEPSTALGWAYLVPFSRKGQRDKECQFIPGYRGLAKLAVQGGEVMWIQSRVVYEKDNFQVHYGTAQSIEHDPFLATDDAGPVIGAYAVAEMKNGAKVFEFMTIAQLEAIRRRSASPEDGPWRTDREEMYRKTTIRRLCKSLPLSEERLYRAMDAQARAESGEGPDYGDVIEVLGDVADDQANVATTVTVTETPSRSDATRDRLQAKAAS
jgi:recombination protein RecT